MRKGSRHEILDIGNKDIRDVIACYTCNGKGKCCFDDIDNESQQNLRHVTSCNASPVY